MLELVDLLDCIHHVLFFFFGSCCIVLGLYMIRGDTLRYFVIYVSCFTAY